MSRSSDTTVLVPSASDWQVWVGTATGGLSLSRPTGVTTAGDIDKLPSSGVLMAFPARQATALPFKTAADDEELFADMAELHVEQMGFRPETGSGRLFDTFILKREDDEEQILMPVVLAPPAPGSTPLRAPSEFDVSARLFPLPSGGIAIWKELGRWVFAIARRGELIYFQGLTEAGLNEAAAREINLAVMQLMLQGCDPKIEQATIWTDEGLEVFAVPAEFEDALSVPVASAPKPAPRLPNPVSELLPEDIVAARYAKAQRRNTRLAIGAALFGIIAFAGYFGFRLFELKQDVAAAERQQAELGGVFEDVSEHFAKWDELEPVIDQSSWPVELLDRVNKAVPRAAKAPGANFRLERVEISDGFIIIEGNGKVLSHVNSFKEALRKSVLFRGYDWSLPDAQGNQDQWSFVYEGAPEGQQLIAR